MPTQTVIWTALPNGLKGEGASSVLKLSVMVSPRLGFDGGATTGTLGSFPEFLDWPERLRTPHFGITLKVDTGAQLAARIVTIHPPDSRLWKALFSNTSFVRAHQPPPALQSFRSYAAADLRNEISRGYASLLEGSPFAPATNAVMAHAFPVLHEAMTPANPAAASWLRTRLANSAALGPEELLELQREIAANLLRSRTEMSLAEKILAAAHVAEALARSTQSRQALPVIPENGDPASLFAQFAAFQHKASDRTSPGTATAPDNRIDFHQQLSALSEYPDVLRRLGLVIDIEVDAAGFPVSAPGNLRSVSAVPAIPIGGTPYMPGSKYLFNLRPSLDSRLPFPHFVTAPRAWASASPTAPAAGMETAEILGGLLNLALARPNDPATFQFDLLQVDLDGGGSKLLNAMSAIAGEPGDAKTPVGGRTELGAPTLRASGISIVRSKQAESLLGSLPAAEDRDAALALGQPLDFFAEDLTRGHRIDVRRYPANYHVGDPDPPGAAWLSLHKRIGTFTFGAGGPGLSLTNIAEEGSIQPVLVQDVGGGPTPPPARVHKSTVNWTGWSVAASPPFSPAQGVLQTAPDTAAAPELPNLKIEFNVEPGSLPRLRFGHYYQVRARTVDLAGNSLTLTEADAIVETLRRNGRQLPILFEKAEDFFRYRRLEPIDAPSIVPRQRLQDGESMGALVIRSMGAPPDPEETIFVAASYNAATERHIVPPKATQMLVERHGMLDDAFGMGTDPHAAFNICRKQAGSLNDGSVVDAHTGQPVPLPDVITTDPDTGAQIRVSNGIEFVPVGASGAHPGYTIHYEEQLKLPYLQDPFARGAALFGLPGVVSASGYLAGNTLVWVELERTIPARRCHQGSGMRHQDRLRRSRAMARPAALPAAACSDCRRCRAPQAGMGRGQALIDRAACSWPAAHGLDQFVSRPERCAVDGDSPVVGHGQSWSDRPFAARSSALHQHRASWRPLHAQPGAQADPGSCGPTARSSPGRNALRLLPCRQADR